MKGSILFTPVPKSSALWSSVDYGFGEHGGNAMPDTNTCDFTRDDIHLASCSVLEVAFSASVND